MKRKLINDMFEPAMKKSKRLRFSEYSSLILTDPKSNEEVRGAWYSKKEMDHFKRDALMEALALRNTRTSQVIKCIAHSAAKGSPKISVTVHNKEKILGKKCNITHSYYSDVPTCICLTNCTIFIHSERD